MFYKHSQYLGDSDTSLVRFYIFKGRLCLYHRLQTKQIFKGPMCGCPSGCPDLAKADNSSYV